MGKTAIEWTEETWNPTTGCTRVSEGCRNCYAFSLHDMRHEAHKNSKDVPAQYAKPFTELQLFPDRLAIPLKRKKPTMWFVNSMSDLFHKDIPTDFLDHVFATMYEAQWHTFQVLTKRPERAAEYFAGETQTTYEIAHKVWRRMTNEKASLVSARDIADDIDAMWPLPNVWIGTSVENQKTADERIPHLLKIPAAVRFLSMEPLLGPVDLHLHDLWDDHQKLDLHWVICGGESGHGARPCNFAWIRGIRDQCQHADVPCFIKQLGAYPVPDRRIRDKKGGNWDEWPEDLRVREFPL